MITELNDEVHYYLDTENNFLNLNQLLNKELEISFEGYQCLCCGKEKKYSDKDFVMIVFIQAHKLEIGL